MARNVGGVDKTIRIIIGILLLVIGFTVQLGSGLRIGAFVVAAIAFITAFTGL
jgi:hypothetical protein